VERVLVHESSMKKTGGPSLHPKNAKGGGELQYRRKGEASMNSKNRHTRTRGGTYKRVQNGIPRTKRGTRRVGAKRTGKISSTRKSGGEDRG